MIGHSIRFCFPTSTVHVTAPPPILPVTPMLVEQLKRKNVTLQPSRREYRYAHGEHRNSYPYFCLVYRQFCKTLQRSIRQTQLAGETMFVDYCGQTVDVIDGANAGISAATNSEVIVAAAILLPQHDGWKRQMNRRLAKIANLWAIY